MRLDGVRVLDLTQFLPGPYATQLLADAGAGVVKIENPDGGDPARGMTPRTDEDVAALFSAVNRGKRSVALDLKTDEGRAAFYRLAEEADAIIEQFRPGVVDRLGIDYETVRTYNEGIVYCSLTGYGQTGPFADRAGHDLNYVALAGLLDMTRRDEDAKPQPPGYQVADVGGGLFAAFAVMGGLLSRELGNTRGQYIDVAMTDVVASFAGSIAHEALTGGDPRPGETPLTGAYPWYDVYECADGRYLTLAALEEKFWASFCETVGREELREVHGTDDPARRTALREELADLFARNPREQWTDELGDETATAPVLTPAEAFDHPQLAARGLVDRPEAGSGDRSPRIGFPALGTDVPESAGGDLPGLGEHTEAVLREAGLSDEDIAALRDAGAIS